MFYQSMTIVNGLVAIGIFALVTSCNSNKTKYEYYDEKKKQIKAQIDLDDEKNGQIVEYYEDGAVFALTNLKSGKLDGVYLRFRPDRSIELESFFIMGLPQKAVHFDSLERISTVIFFDSLGTRLNTMAISPDANEDSIGLWVNLRPLNNKNRFRAGEKIKFEAMLTNITDTAYLTGTLRLASGYKEGGLTDTLLTLHSNRNSYHFEITARPGRNKIVIQVFTEGSIKSALGGGTIFYLDGEYFCPDSGWCEVSGKQWVNVSKRTLTETR